MNVTFYDANPRLRRERGVNVGRVLARFVSDGHEHDPVVIEFAHGNGPRLNGVQVEVLNPEEFPGGISETFMEAARRYCARTLAGEGQQVRGYENEPPARIGTPWSVDVELTREQ